MTAFYPTTADRAVDARLCLSEARVLLLQAGYRQVRFDQYEHPTRDRLVETGYTYGETRLVVRHKDGSLLTDFRLVGSSQHLVPDPKFQAFKEVALLTTSR